MTTGTRPSEEAQAESPSPWFPTAEAATYCKAGGWFQRGLIVLTSLADRAVDPPPGAESTSSRVIFRRVLHGAVETQ